MCSSDLYSLGKTQRILGLLRAHTDRHAWLAPSAVALTNCYREQGIPLLATRSLSELKEGARLSGELVLAPPSFLSSPLARCLGGDYETAFASGWMAQSAERPGGNGAFSRGFPLSDHADWPALLRTIEETGAKRVYVQHRGNGALVRELRARGLAAFPLVKLAKVPSPQLSLLGAAGLR